MFVVGCPRSGTTWVFDILAAHPEAAGVFESWLFTKNAGVGPLFGADHWAARPGGPKGLACLMSHEDFVAELRVFAARVLGRAVGEGDRFLIEKSPSHEGTAEEIAEVFPEARFVHVLRDGRDVCVSLLAAAASWAPQWRQDLAGSVVQAAKTWKWAVIRAREAACALGERLFEVRYEELHADPYASYRALFDFCRMPYDDALLSDIAGRTDFGSDHVTRVYGLPDERGFLRGGRVGDWRTRFSVEDCLAFQLAAGDQLLATGYEADDQWVEGRAAEPPRRSGDAVKETDR